MLRRMAHQPHAQRHVVLEMNVFLEAQRKPVLQFFSLGIEQQDAEHLVIDQPGQQFGNAFQQFIQIQNRGQLTRNFIQQHQGARLPGGARVQPGIFNAHRHARRDQGQHPFVLFIEVVGFERFEIQHPNQLVFHDQGDGQLRTHIRHRRNVFLLLADIVNQNRFAPFRRDSGYALADLDPQPVRQFPRISHLEPEVEFLRLFVEQQDGKNLIVNHLADHLGHALERGVEIERGVDHVRHFQEQGLHLGAQIGLVGCRFHERL